MMVIWNKNITACCLIELKKNLKINCGSELLSKWK